MLFHIFLTVNDKHAFHGNLATSHALSLKRAKKTNHECIVLFCLKISNYFPLKPGHCSF